MSRPPLEVADVVRQHGAAFLARYGPTLSGEQQRALRAIVLCRTAALGGHSTQCDHCGHEAQAYNSCRHRSCQFLAQISHPYTSTKQGGKAFLERDCERVEGAEAHADHPPALPPDDSWYCPDVSE